MFHLCPHLLSLTLQLRYPITISIVFTVSIYTTTIFKFTFPHQLSSKSGFFRQNSERRSLKVPDLRKTNRDTGISSPSRISPPSTPSSPDDTPCLSGDPYNRRRRKIPKVRKKGRSKSSSSVINVPSCYSGRFGDAALVLLSADELGRGKCEKCA